MDHTHLWHKQRDDMKQVTIRNARAQDAPRIVEMIGLLAHFHDDRAQIKIEDLVFLCLGPTPWLTLIVAERNGQIVGYAALQRKVQLQFARRLMDVQHLFVDAHMREQGVGRALMQNAAEQATQLRCAGVTLGVMAHNTSAQAFYKDLGYEMSKEHGALKMVLRLPLQTAACAP